MSVSLDPRIGTELLGYRVEALLGRGGMGVVYLAEDLRLGRKVALKLLAPELSADVRFREDFLRESRLAAFLDHSNVIPIFEAGEVDGVLYIAMRYVEGTDLKKLLAEEGVLEPDRALDITSQTAKALDAAHERGLVHRDVKPANILLTSEGGAEHVYLGDFGLTQQTSSESGLTESGQLVGTGSYIAPEQIERRPVDGRADVYSLGCVLFECLVGDVPYPGERLMSVLWAHVHDPQPRATERRPDLPASLDGVLAKAMAKDPAERYSTCGELVSAARTAVPTSEPEPGAALSSRRLPLVVSAILAALAVALGIGLLLSRGEGTTSLPLASAADSVQRIDQASNRVASTIAVNGEPKGVAVGEGAVWVVSYQNRSRTQAVSRIDPATSAVTRTYDARAGFATGIAVGERAVWAIYNRRGPYWHSSLTPYNAESVESGVDSIQRLDPRRGSFSTAASFRYGFEGVEVGEGAVWALTPMGTVWRIDPRTGKTAKIPLRSTYPWHTGLIAVGEAGVWVAHGPPDCDPPLASGGAHDCAGTYLTHIDPATDRPAKTVRIPFQPAGLAVGDGDVWLTDGAHDSVLRLDPETGAITRRIGVGRNPIGVAVGGRGVWVTNSADGTVSRIDPATNGVVATIEVGARPVAIALGHGYAWVAVAAPY